MRRERQLTLFTRTHCNGEPGRSFVIAAWHPRWSLTWRWLLWWTPKTNPHTKRGFYKLDRLMGLNSRLLGDWHFQTQSTMPKRAISRTELV
jgi:hypothetical protein